jgi:hypothetical protein
MIVILTVAMGHLNMALIYISFMASDIEHFLFFIFLAVKTSSFEKTLFCLFAHFFIGSLIF